MSGPFRQGPESAHDAAHMLPDVEHPTAPSVTPTRIIRVTGEQRDWLDSFYRDPDESRNVPVELVDAHDGAPDEKTLPTVDWCVTHDEQAYHPELCPMGSDQEPGSPVDCRIVRAPLAIHLGVPVQP